MVRTLEPPVREALAVKPTKLIPHDLSLLDSTGIPITATTRRAQFVPALFYWKWDKQVVCSVDQRAIGRLFVERVSHHADSLGMNTYLGARELRIQLDGMPHTFTYRDHGHVLFAIFFYATGGAQLFHPNEEELVLRYTLLDQGQVVDNGTLRSVPHVSYTSNAWHSTRRMAEDHWATTLAELDKAARPTAQNLMVVLTRATPGPVQPSRTEP